MSTDRINMHASIAPAFIGGPKAALESMPQSDPPMLVSAASKARVQSLISSSLAGGAYLIHGTVQTELTEENPSSIRFAPVIIGDSKDEDAIWQEECFASLAACRVVESDEEAVLVANSGGYGLSAAIFTEDLQKGFKLAKKLESG